MKELSVVLVFSTTLVTQVQDTSKSSGLVSCIKKTANILMFLRKKIGNCFSILSSRRVAESVLMSKTKHCCRNILRK